MDFCVAIKGMQNYNVDIERCDGILLIKRMGSEHLKGTYPETRVGVGKEAGLAQVSELNLRCDLPMPPTQKLHCIFKC